MYPVAPKNNLSTEEDEECLTWNIVQHHCTRYIERGLNYYKIVQVTQECYLDGDGLILSGEWQNVPPPVISFFYFYFVCFVQHC